MKSIEIKFEIEIQSGTELVFPNEVINLVGPGRWLVSITPVGHASPGFPPRDHSGFLNSYVIDDEGLYDDYPAA